MPQCLSRHRKLCGFALLAAACGKAFAAAAPLPSSISSAPDDAWVPVMVLADQKAGTSLLGLAQVKDIEDGYPYKIGLYQLAGSGGLGGLNTHVSAGKMTLTPVCATATAPRCEQLVGLVGAASATQVGASAQYQLGPVQLNAGVFRGDRGYTQLLNPYLPFPAAPSVTLLNGSGKQAGLTLQGALNSDLGSFGLGLSLAKTPVALATALTPGSGLGASFYGGQLNEGALSFNWIKGSFGTQLSTRVLEVAGSNRIWGGLDLGLTWRTPWHGTLSFGAKNLVVSGKPPTYLDPENASDAVDQKRVPYVRYQQDL